MNNFVFILGSAVAVAEAVIEATKNTIAKKFDNTLYSTVILGICSIISIIVDIVYNQPAITGIYIFEAIALVVCALCIPQVGYDKMTEILSVLKKIIKKTIAKGV